MKILKMSFHIDAEKSNQDMDNCVEPVVTNNAEPKKMGRAVSCNQMVLLKDSRRRKIKSYTL